ncbi:DCR1B exonuclease, partial [Turnix velox]|nr:DCR1B exonuclease [Turnix velox]
QQARSAPEVPPRYRPRLSPAPACARSWSQFAREAAGAMSGTVLAGTPIAVDFWSIRRAGGARFFFLTHLHSDHTASRPAPFRSAPAWPQLPAPQVPKCWIRPLEVGQSHVVGEEVTVTLLDANHCPGSVMFLFEGTFGTILYTGDFRYAEAMQSELALQGRHIDRLYLDNTHCHPQRVLPSRHHAAQQAVRLIRAHPHHHVVIGVYSLGKEELLVELALEFRTWVVVSPQRLQEIQLMELPDVFTSDEGAGWIRAVDVTKICWDALVSWNKLHPTIAIIPTGRPVKVTHPNIHTIPYSDHSSFLELCEFVKWLKPCSVIPIVKGCVCQAYFQKYLSSAPQTLPDLKMPKPLQDPVQQQGSRKGQESVCRSKRAARSSVSRGVVYESPGKSSEKSEDLVCVEVPQQNCCKSDFCWKEGSACCQVGKKKGTAELSTEEPGAAGAVGQTPLSNQYFPTGLAGEYLLTPLNVLKQNSAQTFVKMVEDFLSRGEES